MLFTLACVYVASGPIGSLVTRFRKTPAIPEKPSTE